MRRIGVEKTHDFARDYIRDLTPHKNHATVIGLSGDLGSGKTTFVQALAHALGVTHSVTSPTFVILKRYPVRDHRFTTLVHIDAYRLAGSDELHALGFEKLLEDPASIIVIEWPEHVRDVLPDDSAMIDFQFIDDKTRRIALRT